MYEKIVLPYQKVTVFLWYLSPRSVYGGSGIRRQSERNAQKGNRFVFACHAFGRYHVRLNTKFRSWWFPSEWNRRNTSMARHGDCRFQENFYYVGSGRISCSKPEFEFYLLLEVLKIFDSQWEGKNTNFLDFIYNRWVIWNYFLGKFEWWHL